MGGVSKILASEDFCAEGLNEGRRRMELKRERGVKI